MNGHFLMGILPPTFQNIWPQKKNTKKLSGNTDPKKYKDK